MLDLLTPRSVPFGGFAIAAGICGLLVVLYLIGLGIYNVYFHPLSRFPGPKLFAAYRLTYSYYSIIGVLPFKIKEAHDRYGNVVRIAPDELAFISGQAWHDIYARTRPQNPKDPYSFLPPDRLGKHSMLMSDEFKHARQRSQLAPAFSSRALQEQQPLISEMYDTLIRQLKAKSQEGPQDMNAWFSWTVFDVSAYLTLGESFHCLENADWHPWVKMMNDSIRFSGILSQFQRYGLFAFFEKFAPESLKQARETLIKYTADATDKRLAEGVRADRPDFTTCILRETKDGEYLKLTKDELYAHSETLVVAGSETTATFMCGFFYALLRYRQDWLGKIIEEVRTKFASDDISEMNFRTISQRLTCMTTCINECMRLYPPGPMGLPRRIVEEAFEVDGVLVPPNTTVSVCQYAAYRTHHNWHRPDEFIPERWLIDEKQQREFSNDNRNCFQPFAVGPRACIGKNLAELETRLAFARLLWNFDLELVEGQEAWIENQRAFLVWQKTPLMIRLKPVRTA